jgi:hypothetical protein
MATESNSPPGCGRVSYKVAPTLFVWSTYMDTEMKYTSNKSSVRIWNPVHKKEELK